MLLDSFFFNGFLGEAEGLEYKPVPVSQHDKKPWPIWGDPGRQLDAITPQNSQSYVVNYPNRTGFLDFLRGELSMLRLSARMVTQIHGALRDVDNTIDNLARIIRRVADQKRPLLVGVSMGGRAVLKAREHIDAHVIALAPAIGRGELDHEALSEGDGQIEVLFSKHDPMLKAFGWYPPLWTDTIVGVEGFGPHSPANTMNSPVHRMEDSSKRPHSGFMPCDEILPKHSVIHDRWVDREPEHTARTTV